MWKGFVARGIASFASFLDEVAGKKKPVTPPVILDSGKGKNWNELNQFETNHMCYFIFFEGLLYRIKWIRSLSNA
jgi:hypothetical protein